MCKLMDDFRNEVARETGIRTTIDTARQFGASEEAILGNIMGKFNLSESEARSYMLKKSA